MPRKPQDLISELQEQFGQFVPGMARAAREDVEQYARAAVTSVLARLDLVTREEFDAQAAVLQRTREKLETLEMRVSTLEAAAQQNQGQTNGGAEKAPSRE